jgi:DnaK suppressor protein
MQKIPLPILPKGYEPSDSEEYMCQQQLDYFKIILLTQKDSLLDESREVLEHLQNERISQPDLNDQAAMEAEAAIEMRNGERKRRLISKIDEALERIETGEYGYCQDTGEPIGLARLKARPIATLCIEAQDRHEKYEKQFAEDQDDDVEDM